MDRWLARLCILAAVAFAFAPRIALASQWGSGYGDPPGFCPAQSRLPGSYLSLPPTNDPLVGNNPEQDTFFGFHSNPGYDDWYGYWYGDFRGRPGDSSGWLPIGTSYLGRPPLHWNFSTWVGRSTATRSSTSHISTGRSPGSVGFPLRTWPTSTLTP